MVPRAGGRVTAFLMHPNMHPDSARPRVKTKGKAEGGHAVVHPRFEYAHM
jgi:hypothetical protein